MRNSSKFHAQKRKLPVSSEGQLAEEHLKMINSRKLKVQPKSTRKPEQASTIEIKEEPIDLTATETKRKKPEKERSRWARQPVLKKLSQLLRELK